MIEKLKKIAAHIGKSPSIKEYRKYRLMVDAPSLQIVLKLFDSFNNYKKEAGLELYNSVGKGMFNIDDLDFHNKFLVRKNRSSRKLNMDQIFEEVDFDITEEIVVQSLSILSEREKKVIIGRLGLLNEKEKSIYEIADEIKTNPTYVIRIEKRALNKIFNEIKHL